MPSTRAVAAYKKQDGGLVFDEATKKVSWKATNGQSTVTIEVKNITNLQQTPATSAKIALKISALPAPGAEVENYVFNFTVRAEQEAMTSELRNAITAARTNAAPSTGPGSETANGTGEPAALAITRALRSEHQASDDLYDDKRLLSNVKLQQSLFTKDPALKQRFEQSLQEKPANISLAQFGTQFWSSRIHLLRAHAIEGNQSQGAYNVLAEIKETNVDGTRKLSLTKEHIQALFSQHPIIRHVYSETVPNKLSEQEFWARFFNSKLLRKLKGEPVTDAISSDHVLDKYLNSDEVTLRNRHAVESHVPHFIDLEGNEQNHSQRQGNQPDWTMRPEASGKNPLLHILNDMSERMMANVAPADVDAHAPIGMDEGTFQQLKLHDLQMETDEDRVILNIKEQKHSFAGTGQTDNFSEAVQYSKMDPAKVLDSIRRDLNDGVHLDVSSRRLEDTSEYTSQIISLLTQQRELSSSETYGSNLSPDIWQSLMLTHSTTSEFLHYFWTLLRSRTTSSSSKDDLASLHATLVKSLDRIAAVADNAERERQAQYAELKRNALEYQTKTGKRRRVDESMVTVGGKKEVEALMGPTIKAIEFARSRYANNTTE